MKDFIEDGLLVRYLTETVTAEENEQVEQWCAMSAQNQRALEQLYFALQVGDRLKVMQSVNPSKALGKLKERIRRQERAARRRIVLLRLQRAAAVLFLPVVSLLAWMLVQRSEMQLPYIELSSNPGMVASFELPDGSKVWLNGGSHLRYPGVFKGGKREVQMSGQGYFEIAHNAQQPFLVRTGDSFSLEVLGTSFNLAAYEGEDIIETTLVEGSVKLMLLQDGQRVERIMKPNEKVVYAKNQEAESVQERKPEAAKERKPEAVRVATVDPQYDIAWKDQRILFKNHPMEEVIRTLGRYYNVQFVVKNEKVMDAEITGKFNNEQLSQVMEYLKIASGIQYRIVPAAVKNGEMIPETVEIWK